MHNHLRATYLDTPPQYINKSFPLKVLWEFASQVRPVSRKSFRTVIILRDLDFPGRVIPIPEVSVIMTTGFESPLTLDEMPMWCPSGCLNIHGLHIC